MENRDKTRNAQFPRVLKVNFYCLSLNVFEQIFKHFLSFEPLPPFISGLNSKFDQATLCVLN